MANDLVFRKPPLTGPPWPLVFGEPDAPSDGGAWASGHLLLPALQVRGTVVAERPSPSVASGALGALPLLVLGGSARYDSATERPLVADRRVAWQQGVPIAAGKRPGWSAAQRAAAGAVARHQDAARLSAGAGGQWEESARLALAVIARHQDAARLVNGSAPQWQEALRLRAGSISAWQEALRLQPSGSGVGWQDGQRLRLAAGVRWQEAQRQWARYSGSMGDGRRIERGAVARWQDGIPPPHGVHPGGEKPDDPCYIPSTALVFKEPWTGSTALVFVCERHTPPVDPGETVVVPIRRAYIVKNTITLTRVDGGDAIPASAFSMSVDTDSWTWQWSATLPGGALPLIESTDGQPVDVLATINGVGYRLCVERYSRERRFASSKISVSGRGRAAILDAPYAPVLNHVGASGLSIAQLLDKVLTINGVGIGWGIDFGIDDWFVPANTWALQGSYIAGVLDIAGAAGAIVQPHRTDPTLRILPRYPAAPWHWGDVTPDFELPAAAVAVEGIEWVTRPDYNRVFVMGATSGGVTGQVTRAGTAGDVVAPQVTHSLITHVDGVRQRGLPELANTGRQAQVALRLQVLPETGIIVPGQFVRYVDGGVTRMGLVRGTSLDGFPQLRQSITLETHLEEA